MTVRFGPGTSADLADELHRLEMNHPAVITTSGEAHLGQQVADSLGGLVATLVPEAQMHVPAEAVDRAQAAIHSRSCDVLVAVGGGSAIGLAKAIALRTHLPIVAIPTTYSGSEMTPIWGITDAGVKRTGRDRQVLPHVVIYDPTLTLTLPVAVSGSSGLNAIAHAVEALYAPDGSPIISLMAVEGIRAMVESLPTVVGSPTDPVARESALYGSWLCGVCLGNVAMSLHHKLCHTLGGAFDLPHADTHAVLLPYVVAFNAPGASLAMRALAGALGTGSGHVPRALHELASAVGAPRSLHQIGLRESDLDKAAALALVAPYANPVPVTTPGVRGLLAAALRGDEPSKEMFDE